MGRKKISKKEYNNKNFFFVLFSMKNLNEKNYSIFFSFS